jgi:hypothetical protein
LNDTNMERNLNKEASTKYQQPGHQGHLRTTCAHKGDSLRYGKRDALISPTHGPDSVEGKKETICFSARLS